MHSMFLSSNVDFWSSSRPWKVMRFNTITLRWEIINTYSHRGEAETACARMNRACQKQAILFKVVFDEAAYATLGTSGD